MSKNSPLVLMILDGWGHSEEVQHNAIAKAHTPQWDAWWAKCPHILLNASGLEVGLPDAQMGNSEVGHMHIGAGRVIQQDFTRINEAIKHGTFQKNALLNEAIETLESSGKSLHIMGLLSPGGVHSHEDHLFKLLELCKLKQFKKVYLHLFLDGRDTPPQSALESIYTLKQAMQKYGVGIISSISGRYYAMDRDKRWERIKPAYDLLSQGESDHCYADATEAIKAYYGQNISDEFIPPTRIGTARPIEDGDALLFFNFRADRARQLTEAFINPAFEGFVRPNPLHLSYFISMTQYANNLPTRIAFPQISMNNTLGEVLATAGLSQLRLAETEKYAHVTFFFNGGKEQPFAGEDRLLIPSPKVATYDLQPEMSAPELTKALIKAINSGLYDVIICNYANADMVGHSGNFKAAVQAVECLDKCMQQVGVALASLKGGLLITADHGNVEKLFDEETHQAHTAHTSGPVPLVYVGEGWRFIKNEGSLIDIAPTMLALLGLTPPPEMTGITLLEPNHG